MADLPEPLKLIATDLLNGGPTTVRPPAHPQQTCEVPGCLSFAYVQIRTQTHYRFLCLRHYQQVDELMLELADGKSAPSLSRPSSRRLSHAHRAAGELVGAAGKPRGTLSSNALRSQHEKQLYETFITELQGKVGELELEGNEPARSVMQRLRNAAHRLGQEIEVWQKGGKVYFQATQPRSGG